MKTTEIELSKSLRKSLDDAEQVLARTAEISTLVTSGEARLSALSAQRIDLEAKHAQAAAGFQLGEVTADVVGRLHTELESTEAESKKLSQVLPVLKQRLAAQQPALTEALLNIDGPLEFYCEKSCEAFAATYAAARQQFEAVCAFGKALGSSLRIDIPMPPPVIPSTSGINVGPGPARVSKVLAELDAAVSQIERSRAGVRRESLRRKPFKFSESTTFEFLRTLSVSGQEFRVGQQVIGSLLGEFTASRLYDSKAVKVL
jgi:hypothetical protein